MVITKAETEHIKQCMNKQVHSKYIAAGASKKRRGLDQTPPAFILKLQVFTRRLNQAGV